MPSLSRAFPFHPIHVGSCRLRRLASCCPRCLTSHPLTTRHHSAITRPVRPSRVVWTPVTPSRAPWRALAAVWCPVTLYHAPLCPLSPLATPSCRATLPRCARAPHHVVWTPAVPRAALLCPLAPRCTMLRAVAPCCAALRRLDCCLAPCPSLSRPLTHSHAPWRTRVALLHHTTPSAPARSLLPPSDSSTHHPPSLPSPCPPHVVHRLHAPSPASAHRLPPLHAVRLFRVPSAALSAPSTRRTRYMPPSGLSAVVDAPLTRCLRPRCAVHTSLRLHRPPCALHCPPRTLQRPPGTLHCLLRAFDALSTLSTRRPPSPPPSLLSLPSPRPPPSSMRLRRAVCAVDAPSLSSPPPPHASTRRPHPRCAVHTLDAPSARPQCAVFGVSAPNSCPLRRPPPSSRPLWLPTALLAPFVPSAASAHRLLPPLAIDVPFAAHAVDVNVDVPHALSTCRTRRLCGLRGCPVCALLVPIMPSLRPPRTTRTLCVPYTPSTLLTHCLCGLRGL
ncbi:hypothetical protein DENSPDRAFT_884285 [Dentipellis sp. KUC8613]|nr:hypothetical protein DENSPDRAFT_884285 [Dentipellis sp. KUC8613]